jgi:hypothetical protein
MGEEQFVCILDTEMSCESRGGYGDKHGCNLRKYSDYATCQYRHACVLLPVAAEKEESPVPVAQQSKVPPVAQASVDAPFK